MGRRGGLNNRGTESGSNGAARRLLEPLGANTCSGNVSLAVCNVNPMNSGARSRRNRPTNSQKTKIP